MEDDGGGVGGGVKMEGSGLESLDLVLQKIAGSVEGIVEMIEDWWFMKETEEKRDADADGDRDEEEEVEDAMVE